jgi:hypothetical protein
VSNYLDLSFIDTQRHCHRRNREYTVGDYCRYIEPSDGEKCSPPNGVVAMVSTLATKIHKTLHHGETDECMVCPCFISFYATNQIYQIPIFNKETNGSNRKQKYIMGARNWCSIDFDHTTGALIFDIRVEKVKGCGETVGYSVRAPAPAWNPPV